MVVSRYVGALAGDILEVLSWGTPRSFQNGDKIYTLLRNLATIIIRIFSVFTPPEFTITGRMTIEIIKKGRISGRKLVPKGGNYEKYNCIYSGIDHFIGSPVQLCSHCHAGSPKSRHA